MRPKGTSAVLERRRRYAMTLLRQGMKPVQVANGLNVSLVSVGRWREAVRQGGRQALNARPAPGRPPKLTAAQRKRLGRLLLRGALAHEYATDLWTLERVAELIATTFGVSYHPSQVWRILVAMGWSCQKPQRRARERDEAAVQRWRRVDWPRIKKRREIRAKRAVSGRDGPDASAAGASNVGAQRKAAGDV